MKVICNRWELCNGISSLYSCRHERAHTFGDDCDGECEFLRINNISNVEVKCVSYIRLERKRKLENIYGGRL